jgi:ABC-type transport system involved in cytochrome c biogenesis permease component
VPGRDELTLRYGLHGAVQPSPERAVHRGLLGIAVIWECDLGILHKVLVSPMPRAALMLGKAISAGVRGLSQAAIIYALAWLVGGQINWHPYALVAVLAVVLLGAACFSRSLRGCI